MDNFACDPVRLIVLAIVGIAILLFLIVKGKLHPIIAMMLSSIAIGLGGRNAIRINS